VKLRNTKCLYSVLLTITPAYCSSVEHCGLTCKILRTRCTFQKENCESILSSFGNLKILNQSLGIVYRPAVYRKVTDLRLCMHVISFSGSNNFHIHKTGHAITQAVSRWLHTAAARVQSRVRSCGICATAAGFLRVL
jgi:hypothetical protein